LDVVAEVTNMMIGNVKTILEQVAGPLAIGVPTVIQGRNFEFRNGSGLKGTSVAFKAGEERFEVRVALAPSGERSPVRSRNFRSGTGSHLRKIRMRRLSRNRTAISVTLWGHGRGSCGERNAPKRQFLATGSY
jgi:hypothetical protein